MNEAVLGANCLLSWGDTDQTVIPPVGLPSASAQVNAAPPHSWTSMPRCLLYQACSAGASFALKKMPPMPVTRFMGPRIWGGGGGLRSSNLHRNRARQPDRLCDAAYLEHAGIPR